MTDFFDDFELIHSYSRSDAIQDGVLVDVTHMAKEMGILYPVAVTSTLWDTYILVDEELQQYGQDSDGRLWDLLWMFRHEAVKSNDSILLFQVIFQTGPFKRELSDIKAVCSPGDTLDPVITIMLPDED